MPPAKRSPFGTLLTRSPSQLHRPFLALVILLLLSVGASVIAGLVGIGELERSLQEVTEADTQRLITVTHIRRLFRSEVVLNQELGVTLAPAMRDHLMLRRERIREERAVLLDRMRTLGAVGQTRALEALRRDHETLLRQGHESAKDWEAATATILNATQGKLTQRASDARAASRTAKMELLVTSAIAVLVAALLGALVLGRVRAAAEALSNSETQFRTVVQSAPSVLAMLSTDGGLIYLPPRAPSVFGIPLEQLQQDPLCWIKGEHHQALQALLREAIAGTSSLPAVALQATRSDGSTWHASASVTPLFDSQQRVSAVILQILDISAQRAAELAQQNLESQLRQAQKMETVGRLAGGVAHDFNNLLTAIQGYASLAQDEPNSQDTAEYISGILQASERATHLTRQLLTFSRKHVISPTATNLAELVRGIEKLLVRVLGEDVHLQVQVGDEIGTCSMDRNQVEQVIMNLAINARHAMPNGGELVITVSNVVLDDGYIARHPTVLPGEYVLLAVSDTGHGMPKEVQEHIFEPFFTTKPVGQGTGLGLSVVYGTVQQHGGSIDVYSESGVGTTIRIYWPRIETSNATPAAAAGVAARPRGTEPVLLVEDDPLVRGFAEKTLVQLGYRVTVASDAEEGLRLTRDLALAPELLVTDVVLPGSSGVDLAQQLKQQLPQLTVLYVSGYAERLIAQRGQLPDWADYLPKPFDAGTLARRVRQVLDRRHGS